MSRKIRNVTASLFAAAILFFLIWPPITANKTIDVRTREKTDVSQLVAALKAYKTEYGDYPRGGHVDIMTALRGDNPRKIVFLEPSPHSLNERGELIDRWKTPYRIEIDTTPIPHVSSAGKNRTFEGAVKNSDDILSWN